MICSKRWRPDPTRADALTWITSYDTIYNSPGIPLFDFKNIAKAGTDPRMLCSWYSGDWCTDSAFAALAPELRANPSMGSWPEGLRYIEQQRRRLPSHKFRRLHLNLPGAPNGAFFDQAKVLACVSKLPVASMRSALSARSLASRCTARVTPRRARGSIRSMPRR
jgi:hypothetical protein